MNKLLEKFNDFLKINNHTFSYVLEDNTKFSFKINQRHFSHLVGIHKLIDLPIVNRFNNKSDILLSSNYLNHLIRKEIITEEIIKTSNYFAEIEDRYNFISSENILNLSFNKVIIDFDYKKAHSKLKSKFLLINKLTNGYIHLGLKQSDKNFVPETFFFRDDDKYIRNQFTINVKHLDIFNSYNQIIFSIDF